MATLGLTMAVEAIDPLHRTTAMMVERVPTPEADMVDTGLTARRQIDRIAEHLARVEHVPTVDALPPVPAEAVRLRVPAAVALLRVLAAVVAATAVAAARPCAARAERPRPAPACDAARRPRQPRRPCPAVARPIRHSEAEAVRPAPRAAEPTYAAKAPPHVR